MNVTTLEDIIESNRLKKETCNNCIEALKGVFTPEKLEEFENAFYTAAQGYIFRRKEH